MSSDHGPGAPSFGDLFEDPDAPASPSRPETPDAAAPSRPDAPGTPEPDHEVPAATTREGANAGTSEAAAGTREPRPRVEGQALLAADTGPTRTVGTAPAPDAAGPDGEAAADEDERDVTPAPPLREADAASPSVPAIAVPAVALPAGAVTVTPTGSVTVTPSAVAPAPVAPPPATPGPVAAEPWDGTVDPSVSSAPAARVDTGRLYRSSGAEGPATLDAIPAIDPDRVPGRRVETSASPVRPQGGTGLTYSGVVVVVGAATVLVAFVEAVLRHQIGALTGLALLVSSVYAALVVRRADIWAAVVVPPLAFLAAALTAGQLTLDKSGSLVIREGFTLFRTLATNAPWILGTTVVCLVVVLVRRRRS